jgi:hypothetical protein
MFKNYYYNSQLKKFIIGFANVFSGLQVATGTTDCGVEMIDVPIRYGSQDRVVASLGASNTQNKQHTLPIMSCFMTNLDLNPERFKGVNQVDKRTYLEQGGVFPTDVKSVSRLMPIPYDMQMELSIYASNSDQMYQILEQILMLFDYSMQIQFNDAPFDWTKITKLELVGISNEENYPATTERRNIIWTLEFTLPIWLSPPYEVRQNIIESIRIRLGDMNNLVLDEVGPDGELMPFATDASIYYVDTITKR